MCLVYTPNTGLGHFLTRPKLLDDAGDMFTAIGWGRTRWGSDVLPDKLHFVDVPFVTDKECDAAHRVDIAANQICAGSAGRDTCYVSSIHHKRVFDKL